MFVCIDKGYQGKALNELVHFYTFNAYNVPMRNISS